MKGDGGRTEFQRPTPQPHPHTHRTHVYTPTHPWAQVQGILQRSVLSVLLCFLCKDEEMSSFLGFGCHCSIFCVFSFARKMASHQAVAPDYTPPQRGLELRTSLSPSVEWEPCPSGSALSDWLCPPNTQLGHQQGAWAPCGPLRLLLPAHEAVPLTSDLPSSSLSHLFLGPKLGLGEKPSRLTGQHACHPEISPPSVGPEPASPVR